MKNRAIKHPLSYIIPVVAVLMAILAFSFIPTFFKRPTDNIPVGPQPTQKGPDKGTYLEEYHWQWSTINTDDLTFPQNFLWGVATSAHQTEGRCCATSCNWQAWEEQHLNKPNSCVKAAVGTACQHHLNIDQDIKLLKELGVNAYRFSIEWSTIEPFEGMINKKELAHYRTVCKKLVAAGIQPVVTLHHYTDPVWFMQKGGFEKDKNIPLFVNYCSTVFNELKEYVHLWATINSPCGYAAKGYLRAMAPPGKKNMQLMTVVYKNILEAHVQTYHALKKLPGGKTARIGILKNMFHLEPYRSWSPADSFGARMGRSLIDDNFFDFFMTGVFNVHIPLKANLKHVNKKAIGALDFVGINYYSHAYIKSFDEVMSQTEEKTDNPHYTVYPEGLYRAIQRCAYLKKPMYVTENGIATTDHAQRTRFLKRHLYALSQAYRDGFDVRGYIHWAFMDNYEWGTYDAQYGLYAVDFASQKRTLKPSAQYYRDVMKKFAGNPTQFSAAQQKTASAPAHQELAALPGAIK